MLKNTALRGGMLLMALALVLLPGCPPQRRPEVRQNVQGTEPTLSLFIAETGRRVSIKMEEYLHGVVAAEMEPTWPREALAAQAILARTFTVERIAAGGVRQSRGTDASTDIKEFQAYNPKRINDNVRQAVAETRGQIVTYNGRPVRAWFHAYSGGRTASPAEGLDFSGGATPYLTPVTDRPSEREARWSAQFTSSQVRSAIRSVTGRDPGAVTRITIERRGPSGRALTLRVNNVSVKATALRLAIGSTRMRSTLLDSVSTASGRVAMRGRGYGHGVGLSQLGALKLAKEGRSAQEIIDFYFTGVVIEQRWR
ncbi:MAG: SpoIID/LytB domain-containing protein [Bacillota bacterium]